MELSPPALRVLGALVEKAMATPQSYPLSLNALTTACNQTTNREPVVDYDEATVRAALQELSGLDLVSTTYASRSNTPKWAHGLDAYFELDDAQTAVLAVLLLRGPQTVGELRQRTDRLHAFPDVAEVAAALEDLRGHPLDPLVVELERQPGQKETRWVHLLGGEDPAAAAPRPAPVAHAAAPQVSSANADVAALAEEVEELRDALETLQAEVERLRRRVDG